VDTPTATDVRAWSKLAFDEYGFGEYDGAGGVDPLDRLVTAACDYITFVTTRVIDADTPTMLVSMIEDAVQLRVEQTVMQRQTEHIETAGDIDMISSLSVAGYSESRRDTSAKEPGTLNPWPALDALLWRLLSPMPGEDNAVLDDRRAYWQQLLSGQPAPAWETVEVDWSGNYYRGGVAGSWPGLVYPWPWDY
jgi:hypothetical protein